MWKIAVTVVALSFTTIFFLLGNLGPLAEPEQNNVDGNGGQSQDNSTVPKMSLPKDSDSPEIYDAAMCRKGAMVVGKKFLKLMIKCQKQYKEEFPDPKEFQKHFQCTLRCTMREAGMLTQHFRMTNESINTFFAGIPQKYSSIFYNMGLPCVQEFGHQMNGDDEYCQVFGKYMECTQNRMVEKCVPAVST